MSAIGEQISAILWNIWNRPRLIDLIDILLLTFIIYELLVHVRQTRVSQTIKGIIILLLATWLSDVLGMRTIHALLAWMINAGPVLLIVLFQLRPTWLLNGFNAVLDALALFAPFDDFVGGMFSVPDIVYYLSVAGLFLFLTGEALERRRWN